MRPLCSAGLMLGAILAIGSLTAEEPNKSDKPKPREDAKLGLVLVYPEKGGATEYFQKHPCVSGGWQFKSETETHWIGSLNYPTGNVPPAYPTDNEAAFVVGPLKVAKKPGLVIDMKKWQGTVVLLMADTKERFGTKKSLATSFELVAYQIPPDRAAKATFLFKKRAELLYQGAEK
jgi:hypothetical protein